MGSQQRLVGLGGWERLPEAQGRCCVPPPCAATTSKNEKASAGTQWKSWGQAGAVGT